MIRELESWSVRWLLVFDNYDDPHTFSNIKDFIPRSGLGAILVTSRHGDSSALVVDEPNNFIELQGLPEQAALDLLAQECGVRDLDPVKAMPIVEMLGYHPLAITQAGAYIKKRDVHIDDFIDHYNRRRKTILEHTPLLSQYKRKLGDAEEEVALNVFTNCELSFQHLASQTKRDSREIKLLTLFAFFDRKNISEQVFTMYTKLESTSEIKPLSRWMAGFYDAKNKWDQEAFKDALIKLKDSCLIQAFVPDQDGFYCSSLHPLIRDWIRLRTDVSLSQENCVVLTALISLVLKDSYHNENFEISLSAKQVLISHVFAQGKNHDEYFLQGSSILPDQMYIDFLVMCSWLTRFVRVMGFIHLYLKMTSHALKEYEKVLGVEHILTLEEKSKLTWTYKEQKRWDEAEELAIEGLKICNEVLGAEHPETLRNMALLVSIYLGQGYLEEAGELGLQILEMRKNVLGVEHFDTLESMGKLAMVYSKQRHYKKAEELELQALEIRTKMLGVEHPRTLINMHILAVTYFCQGRKDDAINLMTKVVRGFQAALGTESPRTIYSTDFLRGITSSS